MAGRGRVPKKERRNASDKPIRGEWADAEGVGWQYGERPAPPDGLMPASLEAWLTWFGAWFAVFWKPEDVPALRHLVRLYDEVERGETQRHSELRLAMDTYGITPKGQQDRRWQPPSTKEVVAERESPYAHLRAVE